MTLETLEPPPVADREPAAPRRHSPRLPDPKWKRTTHKWTRWLHVYTSMISLLLVLFFGITGITLNHPDWTFGSEPTRSTIAGELPAEAVVDGRVELLVIAEFVRNEHGVSGEVKDFSETGGQGSISFKKPGYSADVFFDASAGEFELLQVQQGWLTVINELHKGRDGDSSWRWVIDVSGAVLVAISLTGIGLQLFLRKRRRSALAIAGVGTFISLVFIWLTLN